MKAQGVECVGILSQPFYLFVMLCFSYLFGMVCFFSQSEVGLKLQKDENPWCKWISKC